jgi:hypothetical protein
MRQRDQLKRVLEDLDEFIRMTTPRRGTQDEVRCLVAQRARFFWFYGTAYAVVRGSLGSATFSG